MEGHQAELLVLYPSADIPERLTGQAIWVILEMRFQQAKVKPFTPHDLRRTFAGEMLDAGVDLVTV